MLLGRTTLVLYCLYATTHARAFPHSEEERPPGVELVVARAEKLGYRDDVSTFSLVSVHQLRNVHNAGIRSTHRVGSCGGL